jgi:hypothetical protein
MRYQTIPRWTYVMLIVMGLGFMAGAFGFVLFVPQPTGDIVGGVWLVMGAGMAFFSLRSLRGSSNDDRIRREGTAATATLISATPTNWTINNVPQWKLRLRIEGAGAPYETSLKLLTYTPPSDGARLGVCVDPLKREHVVLSGDDPSDDPAGGLSARSSAATAASPQVQAAVLEALRQAGLAQGESAVVNADGSRTITTTSFAVGDGSSALGPADTVRLLADLDRLRADGSLTDAEFTAVKAKLLGGGG